jgi:hypothetical protein
MSGARNLRWSWRAVDDAPVGVGSFDDGADNDDDGVADHRTDGAGDPDCSDPTDGTE